MDRFSNCLEIAWILNITLHVHSCKKKKRKTIGQSCFLLLITSERPKRDVAAPFGKQRNWRKAYFLALTVLSWTRLVSKICLSCPVFAIGDRNIILSNSPINT